MVVGKNLGLELCFLLLKVQGNVVTLFLPLTSRRKMRSRSNSLEDVTEEKPLKEQADTRKATAEREEPSGRAERRSRHRETPDDTGTIQRNNNTTKNSTCGGGGAGGAAKGGRKEKARDLSRDDLVFLLSLLEGELQVILSDVICEDDSANWD